MKAFAFSLLAGVLSTAVMIALAHSPAMYIACGITSFIFAFVVFSVFYSSSMNLKEKTVSNAMHDARTRLNSIRISAIESGSAELIQSGSELNSSFEEALHQIEGRADGYSRLGLTLALLKPLAEAAEQCTQSRGDHQFPEMVQKLQDAISKAIEDLTEKADRLTEADVLDFEIKCNTVKRIAENN